MADLGFESLHLNGFLTHLAFPAGTQRFLVILTENGTVEDDSFPSQLGRQTSLLSF